jgi:AcrR family transcriptional regulator
MPVKPDSGHRARQAEATRIHVARTARRLFAEHGYGGTTVSAIAAAAKVPEQTIYSSLRSKAGILEQIRTLWIEESDTQRQHDQALAQPDPARRLRMAAHWHRQQMELGSDVIAIYEEAARTDPAMEEEWRRVRAGRDRAIGRLIASLKGHLKPGLSQRAAVDIYVACTLAEGYRTLVPERGWSPTRFENWLGDLLIQQLLHADALVVRD